MPVQPPCVWLSQVNQVIERPELPAVGMAGYEQPHIVVRRLKHRPRLVCEQDQLAVLVPSLQRGLQIGSVGRFHALV